MPEFDNLTLHETLDTWPQNASPTLMNESETDMNHDHPESGTPSSEPTPPDADPGDITEQIDISVNVQRHHLSGLCLIHLDEKDMAQLAPEAAKRLEHLLANSSWRVDIHGPQDVFQLVLYPERFDPGPSELTARQDRSDEAEEPHGHVEKQTAEWFQPQAASMCLEVSDELVMVLYTLEETAKAKLAQWSGRPVEPQMVWDLVPTWREGPWLDFPSTVLASGGSVHHESGISLGISTKPGVQLDHAQVRTAFEAWMCSGVIKPDQEGDQ